MEQKRYAIFHAHTGPNGTIGKQIGPAWAQYDDKAIALRVAEDERCQEDADVTLVVLDREGAEVVYQARGTRMPNFDMTWSQGF